jgi:glycerate kinase
MKIVIAPDSFKGSISSTRAVEKMAEGIREEWPEAQIIPLPLADGGEGTVDALLGIMDGVKVTVQVKDPLGREIPATYGWIEEEKLAVIETAAASGLPLLSETERNPKKASSFGTGQLISRALGRGAKKIILGLGGSATVDAGMGILQALGARFYDRSGQVLKGCGEALGQVERIDLASFDPRAAEVPFILASDVENPLLGPTGAVHVFGPQKGVTVFAFSGLPHCKETAVGLDHLITGRLDRQRVILLSLRQRL